MAATSLSCAAVVEACRAKDVLQSFEPTATGSKVKEARFFLLLNVAAQNFACLVLPDSVGNVCRNFMLSHIHASLHMHEPALRC